MHKEFLRRFHQRVRNRSTQAGSEAATVELFWRHTAPGLLAAFALVLSTASPGRSQILYGSVVGTVTDATKAVVPSAEVDLKNENTGEVRKATTNAEGQYTFSAVSPGTYDVTVTSSGFRAYTLRETQVAIDQIARVDAVLTPGQVSQSVEVSSAAPPLQTDSAQVQSEIDEKAVQNLPVGIDSNYESLLITVPGVTPPDDVHSYSANPSRGLTFQVNGTTANSNDVRVDGVSAMNVWLPDATSYVPSRQAIEEVSVVTNSFNVSQGIVGGAAVNVHIKSGTNSIHGSAYETNMNNALEAQPYAFVPPLAGQKNPKLINNDFGGTIGGPIKKNHVFYFLSYEGNALRQEGQVLQTVPTAAFRAGDFSAGLGTYACTNGKSYSTPCGANGATSLTAQTTAGTTVPVQSGMIFDPSTGTSTGTGRQVFVSTPAQNSACTNPAGCLNIIPTSRLDSTALNVQNTLVELPNEAGLTNNFFASGPFKSDRHTIDAKADWNTTQKLHTSARLGLLHYDMSNAPIFGNNGPPVSSVGARSGNSGGNVYNVTAGGNYLAKPNLTVDGYFGVTLMSTNTTPPDTSVNEGIDTLHIPGTNGATTDYGGWPAFLVSNYAEFGSGGNSNTDVIHYQDSTYIGSGDAHWTIGKHSVLFGGQVTRANFNHFELANATGTFSFDGGVTTLNATGAPGTNQFNSYAAFLLGLPSSISKDLIPFNGGRSIMHWWQYSAFIEDQWRLRSNLTLYYGVSWNYFPFGAQNGRGLERYSFDTNQVELCGVNHNPMNCGYDISKTDFSPALGIAYQMAPNFVVRAGAGLSYDPEPLAYLRDIFGVYPDTLSETFSEVNSHSSAGIQLSAGIPAISVPDISSGFVNLPAAFGISTLTPDYHRDYVESWNLTAEEQLPAGWVSQVGYVGTRQLKVPGLLNQNIAQVGGGAASSAYFARNGTSTLNLETPVNHIYYDALQARLTHNFRQGFQVGVSYTWSKNIGYCCNNLADGGPAIQIPQYLSLNRSLEPWDRRHQFVATTVAELPFGQRKPWLKEGWGARVAGGWQANAIITAYTGTPFSVTTSATSLNAPGNTQRADLIGNTPVQITGNIGVGKTYFDTSRFAAVTQPRFGTASFDLLRGPGAANMDFGLFRTFSVTERWKLQFRGEALNATNTPHFGTPNGNQSSTSFGQVTSVKSIGREGIDQRIFRLGAMLTF